MNTLLPSGAAEARARLTLEVEALKVRFKARIGIEAKQVRLGHWADWYLTQNLFDYGDELAGLYVDRGEKHSDAIEVGIWETNE